MDITSVFLEEKRLVSEAAIKLCDTVKARDNNLIREGKKHLVKVCDKPLTYKLLDV